MAASGVEQKNGNGFVELFESQREHVKQQLKLERRIDEMKGILAELETYTQVQKSRHEAELSLLQANQVLKTCDGKARQLIRSHQQENQDVQEQQKELVQEQSEIKQVLAACSVVEARELCEKAKSAYERAKKASENGDRKILKNQTQRNNLELARIKEALRKSESLLQERQTMLASLQATANEKEILAALQENSAHLHGLFSRQEQDLEEIRRTNIEKIQKLQEQIQSSQSAKTVQDKEQRRLMKMISSGEGRIEILLRQQETIEQEILTDSLHQDAEVQGEKWRSEQESLQRDLGNFEKNIDFYQEEERKTELRLHEEKKREKEKREQLHEMELFFSKVNVLADDLRTHLQMWPHCANLVSDTDGLYQRLEFFHRQIQDDIVEQTAHHDALDERRRTAHRWLDLYGSMDAFSADPVLEDKLDEWSADFLYLKGGAEFFRSYSGGDKEKQQQLYARYPFWASAIITIEDEVDKLLLRLQKTAGEFFEPVFVLTDVELRTLVQDEQGDNIPSVSWRAVVPAHWQNIQPEKFALWLENARKRAAEADDRLWENQRNLQELQALQRSMRDFSCQFPFTEYQEKQESKRNLLGELEILGHQLETDCEALENCRKNKTGFQEKRGAAQKRIEKLSYYLKRLSEYQKLQQEHQAILQQGSLYRQQLTALEEKADILAKDILKLQQEQSAVQEFLASNKVQRQILRKQLYWQDAQNAPAIFSSEDTYEGLAESRRRLESRLEGVSSSRVRLTEQIHAAERDKERLTEEIERLHLTAETELDENMRYPADGAEQEKILLTEYKTWLTEIKILHEAAADKRSAYDQKKGICSSEEKRYFRQYETMLSLTKSVSETRCQSESKLMKLGELQKKLGKKMQFIQQELKGLSELLHTLDIKNARLGYAGDHVEPAMIQELEHVELCEQLHREIIPRLQNAETAWEKVQEWEARSIEQRDSFIAYCEKKVKEEKLRRSIVDGIRSKLHYEEYLEWQVKSRKRLENVIQLSEAERKSHVEHMEHMLEHIVLHLRMICEGMRNLAAKTRVKVGETTKDIVLIQLPDWQEAAARTAIRGYLNRLAIELDKDIYQDEMGREDSRKIRDFLQKRLRTQQMLHVVMENQTIKVRCRKATDSNDFSERPYSWEESNRWSGGEMWSKNMALFLGCLNYLSEKRCHIRKA